MRSNDISPSLGLIATLVYLTSIPSSAFYIPGAAPTDYKVGDNVPLNVNHLTPGQSFEDGEVHSVFAFDYYHPAFRFCRPEGGPQNVPESLGSILFGDRITTSPFDLRMAQNESCKAVCEEKKFDPRSAKFVNRRIWQNYNINLLIDRLPAGQPLEDIETHEQFVSPGIPLGYVEEGQARLNNHYDIYVEYHEASKNALRVVGVLVAPSSRKDSRFAEDGNIDCGNGAEALVLDEDGETAVVWTYGVYWIKSSTAFATRWDKLLSSSDPKIHWFSLINSAVIVVFLTGMVAMILLRALRKDFARYNRLDQIDLDDLSGTSGVMEDGVQEDSGWKLVHGDVFRTPKNPLMLSVFLGSGAQLFVMTGLTIAFALFGFLSPSSRGLIGTVMIMLYTFFGFVGGYVSARVYKTFGGESWKQNIALTPVLIPGIVFATFFLLNLFLWGKRGASGAVPFSTMILIVGIWFLISMPLSFAGSWVGFRQPGIPSPVRTNQIPRQIPPAVGYLRPLPSMLLVGILPFGAIFVELYLIMKSIWSGKEIYYMFGFLFICYGLMIMSCAMVTILMVYFLLCAENYRWHWRAFFTAGASAGYVFLNALIYWMTRLKLGGITGGLLYVGYSALISFLFFILTGTIGYFASWAFVHKIYGSIKVD